MPPLKYRGVRAVKRYKPKTPATRRAVPQTDERQEAVSAYRQRNVQPAVYPPYKSKLVNQDLNRLMMTSVSRQLENKSPYDNYNAQRVEYGKEQQRRQSPAYWAEKENRATPWYYKEIPSPQRLWNKLMWYSAGGDRPPGMGELYRYPREPQTYYPYFNPYMPPGSNANLDVRNTAVQEYLQRYSANNFRGPTRVNYTPVAGVDEAGKPKFLKQQGKSGPNIPKTTGVLEEKPYKEPPVTEYGGGGGGGGYYPGGGGGGTDYGYAGSPFAEYQKGYTSRPYEPNYVRPAFRSPGTGASNYYNNPQTVYGARWQQLLTSWRI